MLHFSFGNSDLYHPFKTWQGTFLISDKRSLKVCLGPEYQLEYFAKICCSFSRKTLYVGNTLDIRLGSLSRRPGHIFLFAWCSRTALYSLYHQYPPLTPHVPTRVSIQQTFALYPAQPSFHHILKETGSDEEKCQKNV